jgi:hypothetical protein
VKRAATAGFCPSVPRDLDPHTGGHLVEAGEFGKSTCTREKNATTAGMGENGSIRLGAWGPQSLSWVPNHHRYGFDDGRLVTARV